MRYFLITTWACALLLAGWSCKKNKNGGKEVIQIQGFRLVDATGNFMGQIGSAEDDWKLYNSLSAAEIALLNFNTPHTLDNTSEASISLAFQPFPNPFSNAQYYATTVSDSVLLKVVIVNNKLNVLKTAAFKIKGYHAFALDYSDRAEFPNKSSLRIYYSFSAMGKPHFKIGYGDIKVCDEATPSTYNQCF